MRCIMGSSKGGVEMREIKFRGKRIDNGEWVYGSLCTKRKEIAIDGFKRSIWVDAIQVYMSNNGETYKYVTFEVIPETVGQYTGLKDKNGKEIYEGDIVNVDSRCWRNNKYQNEVVKYCKGIGFYPFNEVSPQIDLDYICSNEAQDVEVVGNIHDNPEFLEATNE